VAAGSSKRSELHAAIDITRTKIKETGQADELAKGKVGESQQKMAAIVQTLGTLASQIAEWEAHRSGQVETAQQQVRVKLGEVTTALATATGLNSNHPALQQAEKLLAQLTPITDGLTTHIAQVGENGAVVATEVAAFTTQDGSVTVTQNMLDGLPTQYAEHEKGLTAMDQQLQTAIRTI